MKNTKETIVLMLCLSLIFSPSAVFAAPQGGKVVGGSANIHQSGATTTINQSSDRAVINWHSFDIGKNEAVRHNMPSRNSAGLHRVVGGGGASQIQGLLQSNGNVYLVNPAGVVIHKGARVDTNSFIATTRDIADSNFMKGHMAFDKPGRPDAQIINQGTISVRESGLAALVAPTVRNEGLIAGKLGKVALASGDTTWKLDMHGDDLITFTVDEKNVNALHTADGTPLAGVENSGSIKAEGGVVVLTAAQLDGIVGSVVNSGEVSAASAELKGGKITFRGQGSDVDIVNTGSVDVSSTVADGGTVRMDTDGKTRSSGTIAATGGQKGGKVTLTGREVALAGGANIDVSGNTSGGTALVGGNALGKGPERNAQKAAVERGASIHADAKVKGDGGQVVVWSDEKTTFDGTITAKGGSEGGNGGQVETSGNSLKVGDNARVETLAPRGLYGQWLLDPMDFVIAASGGDMTGAQLSSNLASSNVEIKSSQGNSGTNGDIFVNDAVSWAANTTLTLTADHNVNVNGNITATGANAGLTITPQNGVFNLMGGKITLTGSNPTLNIAGQSYTVINSIQELQAINNSLKGNFALGSNIDASSTASWNNGAGFDPIGNKSSVYHDTSKMFKGIFNGLGNSISGLTINRPNEDYVGLFGYIYDGAQVLNVGLENVNITGRRYVGALAGSNGFNVSTQGVQKQYSIINNSFSSGSVKGYQAVGGLAGTNYGEISHSSSYTNVTVENERGGGLVGSNSDVIYSSFSSGNVNGGYIVGGFVGDMMTPFGGSAYISNSYSTGNVSGTQVCGGFIGNISFDDAKILNSYSTGKVSGASSGGFAGNSYAQCSVINSYWDIINSGLNNGVGQVQQADQVGDGTIYWTLQGLTTEQLVQKNSYNGWDFNNIWSIVEGKNYPQLISVAVNSSGQSSTENVYQTPITPPTPDPDPTPTPEITIPLDKPNPMYIKDDKTYWILKDGDRITKEEKGNTIVIRDGEIFTVPDETIFVADMDNDSDNIDHETKLEDDKNTISEEKVDASNIQNENSEKRIDRLINEINTAADQALDSLYDEFYTLLKENIKEVNDAPSQALNNIKSQLKFTPLSFGTSKTLPDDVYRAIAEAILETMGASKVEKYADNLSEFNKQLYSMVKGGSLNKTYITKINGITYTINLQAFLYGGVGFSGNPVQWKDANNKPHSGYVYWASSPSETMSAISEYCLALSKINTKAWTEVVSYFITGTPDSKIVNIGSKVVEALCATNPGKALAETIGTEFKKEYKSGLFGLKNTFKEFVKQLPGGEKLVNIAETIAKVKDVSTKTVTQIKKINDLKNNYENFSKDSTDIVHLVNLLNNSYNFSTTEMNKLSQKITELENIYKQEKTARLNDLP